MIPNTRNNIKAISESGNVTVMSGNATSVNLIVESNDSEIDWQRSIKSSWTLFIEDPVGMNVALSGDLRAVRCIPGWDSSKPSRVRITWLKASTLCQGCRSRLLVKVNDMQRSHSTRQDTPLESPRNVGMRLTFNSVLESSTSRIYVHTCDACELKGAPDTRYTPLVDRKRMKNQRSTLVSRFHSENSRSARKKTR